MAAVPVLETQGLSISDGQAPPTPHMHSGRRLSKSVMTADSGDTEGSKGWGLVALPSGHGTARAVRVVQTAQAEDFNMINIKWVFNLPDRFGNNEVVQQVELRHGRRSGIRKIYVNKQLVEREKSLWKAVSNSGSTHSFMIGPDNRNECTITIYPKGSITGGYQYQLELDGRQIEKQTAVGEPTIEGLDIGVRAIQLPKDPRGLGMTLRNNPLGPTGVVVWTVEPGKAAELAGIRIGDVVLSIEDNIVNSIDNLVEYVSKSVHVVNMELAGDPNVTTASPNCLRQLATRTWGA